MTKILHYLNQFFAGIGGEDKAGQEFLFLTPAVGSGVVLRDLLKSPEVEYATVVCGDNFFHENEEAVLASLTEAVTQFAPDLFIAGPAFHAGRTHRLRQGGQLRAPTLEHTGGDGSL